MPTSRAIRYQLQRTAGRLLFDPAAGKRQAHRVCHCCRSLTGEFVGIYRTQAEQGTRASFTGTITCGSGWTCPVCALKIAEARRVELSAALVQHTQAGARVQLLTYTFAHQLDQALSELDKRLADARQRFKNCRDYKRVMSAAGRLGSVTSAEVTYGRNGWHPHLHELAFLGRSLTDAECEQLKAAWTRVCLKAGLIDQSDVTDHALHGLDIRGGEDAAAYVTKYGREEQWGLSSELTRSHTKDAAPDGHYKPFGLLALADAGQAWAGARFVEFANVYRGRRLLTWSPGLRARFDLAELEDAELAELPEREFVGRLTPPQWHAVLRADARAELLDYAADFCINPDTAQADLDDFVRHLEHRPPRSRAWFVPDMAPWRPGIGWVRVKPTQEGGWQAAIP